MDIRFCLNNEERTIITTMSDMVSDPFSVGDLVHLEVKKLNNRDLNDYPLKLKLHIEKNHNEMVEQFRLKDVVLVGVGKYIEFNAIKKNKITIEYMCDIVD